MKKIFIALFFSLALAACATFPNPLYTGGSDGRSRLAAIESSYGIALSVAVAYRRTRLCKKSEVATFTNICASRAVILELQAADREAQRALIAARIFVRNNPTIDAFQVLGIAQNSVLFFQNVLAAHGIR